MLPWFREFQLMALWSFLSSVNAIQSAILKIAEGIVHNTFKQSYFIVSQFLELARPPPFG